MSFTLSPQVLSLSHSWSVCITAHALCLSLGLSFTSHPSCPLPMTHHVMSYRSCPLPPPPPHYTHPWDGCTVITQSRQLSGSTVQKRMFKGRLQRITTQLLYIQGFFLSSWYFIFNKYNARFLVILYDLSGAWVVKQYCYSLRNNTHYYVFIFISMLALTF